MNDQSLNKKPLPPPPPQISVMGQLREIKQELSELKQIVKELSENLNSAAANANSAPKESSEQESLIDAPVKHNSISSGQILMIGVILFTIYFICNSLYQAVNTPLLRSINDSARQAAQAACESDQALNRSQGNPDNRDCTNP